MGCARGVFSLRTRGVSLGVGFTLMRFRRVGATTLSKLLGTRRELVAKQGKFASVERTSAATFSPGRLLHAHAAGWLTPLL